MEFNYNMKLYPLDFIITSDLHQLQGRYKELVVALVTTNLFPI